MTSEFFSWVLVFVSWTIGLLFGASQRKLPTRDFLVALALFAAQAVTFYGLGALK